MVKIRYKTIELIVKIIRLEDKFFPQIEFNLVFKTSKKLENFFNFKDKTEHNLRSKVVYKIRCKDCDSFYIGKTVRNLITRVNEHREGLIKDKDSSVSDHSKRFGHEIDWNNVEIIDVARSNMHLLWKEMLHIYKDKPTMNKQLKSELFCLLIGQKTKDNI